MCRRDAPRRVGTVLSTVALLWASTMLSSWSGTPAVGVAATSDNVTTSTSRTPVRLCFIPTAYIPADSIFIRHGAFAARYFGQQFPELDVTFTFATVDGGSTPSSVIRGVMQDDVQNCHALLGPLASSTAIGVSPVINMPWLSHTASAVELANKYFHPWFSSVMPTDAFTGGALAAAVAALGWRTVSAVLAAEPYSTSYFAGFNAGLERYADGGEIELSVLLNPDATADEIRTQLLPLRTVKTRVVAILVGLDGLMSRIIDAIVELELDRSHVIFLGDAACATGWPRLAQLHGVMCTNYFNNATAERPYIDAWLAHNTSDFDYFVDFGVPPPPADYIWGGVLNSVLPDAVHALLDTFRRHLAGGGSLFDRQAVNDALRNVNIPGGISGAIELNEKGERIGAAMGFYNVQPSNTSSAAYVLHQYGVLTPEGTMVRTDNSALYWRVSGSYGQRPDVIAAGPPEAFTPSAAFVVIILALVILLLVVALFIFKVGFSETGLLVKLMRAGLLTSITMALLNFANVVVAIIALIRVVSDGRFSIAFAACFGVATVIGCTAAFAEFLVCALFTWRWLSLSGGMALNHVSSWHVRMASAGVCTVAINNVPKLALTTAALILQPDSPAMAIVVELILHGVMVGVKHADILFMVTRITSLADVEAVHAAVRKEFGDDVMLNRMSDPFMVLAANLFLQSEWKARDGILDFAARRIVVSMGCNDVSQYEFFAVVWNILGDLYSLLDEHHVHDAQRRMRDPNSASRSGSHPSINASESRSIERLVDFAANHSGDSVMFSRFFTMHNGVIPKGVLSSTAALSMNELTEAHQFASLRLLPAPSVGGLRSSSHDSNQMSVSVPVGDQACSPAAAPDGVSSSAQGDSAAVADGSRLVHVRSAATPVDSNDDDDGDAEVNVADRRVPSPGGSTDTWEAAEGDEEPAASQRPAARVTFGEGSE